MKKYKLLQILVCTGLLLLNFHTGYSQEKYKLTGKITSSSTLQPLEGAVVSVKGVSESVQTDGTGQFSIEIPSTSTEVEVWSPGYYTYKYPLLGRTEIAVSLIPENEFNYSETLVKPLGDDILQNKSTAIDNIGKQGFALGSTTVEQAIYNALPGLRTVNKSGTPGEGAYFNSRGIKSFIGNSAPLIVINNVPYVNDMSDSYVVNGYSTSILNSLNPNDVKNITYLRGSDASIYGSLGSNGVIMIETDNATDNETKVEFIGQYGLAFNNSTLPVMEADDYKSYIGNIAITRYDDPAKVLDIFPFLKDDPDNYYKYLYNNNTDWQDEIYRTAFVTDNLLKIKGGDAIAVYDLSLGYYNQNGVIDNSDLSRYHARINGNINVSQKVDIFASISMAYLTSNFQEQGMELQTNPVLAALAKSPLKSPYQQDEFKNNLPDFSTVKDDNGNIYEDDGVSNPLAIVKSTEINSKTYDVIMNGGINYHVTPDIKLTGMAGFFYNYNKAEVFIPGVGNSAIMPLSDNQANNTVRKGIKETHNLYFNLNGSWNKTYEAVHNVSAAAGWQMMKTRREYDSGTGMNTASDYYKNLENVSTIGRFFYGYIDFWNWMNFFAKAEYNYNHLLFAGVNMAYDGASSTGSDATRFHVYPSVNAAWNIKNMPGLINSKAVNNLRLRAEFTNTGNSNYSSMISEYYYVTQTFKDLSSIVRSGIPNTKIVPEKTGTFNVGLDAAFLNNGLSFTLDAYHSTTRNVILDKTISPVFGFSTMYDNMAKIQNSGLEFGIQGYLYRNKDWKWLAGGTIAHNKNEIKDLGGESEKIIEMSDGSALISRKGESAYSFYGYKTDGVYSTTTDALNDGYTNYAGTAFGAGDIRFIDQNNDGIIDKNDRVILGDANPNIFGRFYTSVSYKSFTLTANFTYSQGNKAYNAVRRNSESMQNFNNQLVSVNRRWQEEGQITDIPRAVYGDPMQNSRFSDRWIEDASFIKLKELTLSYTFDRNLIKFVEGGTFYVSGENLATWTKYLGLDPEFSYSYSSMLQGFDYAKVAQPINVKIGVNLQF